MAKIKPQKDADPGLPPDVTAADLERKWGTAGPRERLREMGLPDHPGHLTFYFVPSLGGWVITTLLIGRGTRGQPDRYYGIGLDGKTCRVGSGPHVKATVEVCLSADNFDRLKRYVDLHQKGLAAAGATRDRISSRRAQGQQMRAEGRSRWRWDF